MLLTLLTHILYNIAKMLYSVGTNWKVCILNSVVEKELESLDAAFKAKFIHITRLLEQFGPSNVKEPYCKPLGKKLWEIRMKAQPGIARAIYVTTKGKKIVILHAFVKKTQKTLQKAVDLALKRVSEIEVES